MICSVSTDHPFRFTCVNPPLWSRDIQMDNQNIRRLDTGKHAVTRKQTLTQAQEFVLPVTPNFPSPQAADSLPPGQTAAFVLAEASSSTRLAAVTVSHPANNGTQRPSIRPERQKQIFASQQCSTTMVPLTVGSKNSSVSIVDRNSAQSAVAGRPGTDMSDQRSSRSSSGRSQSKSTVPSAWWRAMNYRCHFCMKVLAPMKMGTLDRFLLLLSIRQYYCQHCFIAHYRPFGPLKLLLAPLRWVYFNLADEE